MITVLGEASDEELITQAQSLYGSIFVVDCFSTADMILYDQTINELEERGYECQPVLQVTRPEGG